MPRQRQLITRREGAPPVTALYPTHTAAVAAETVPSLVALPNDINIKDSSDVTAAIESIVKEVMELYPYNVGRASLPLYAKMSKMGVPFDEKQLLQTAYATLDTHEGPVGQRAMKAFLVEMLPLIRGRIRGRQRPTPIRGGGAEMVDDAIDDAVGGWRFAVSGSPEGPEQSPEGPEQSPEGSVFWGGLDEAYDSPMN